MSTMLIGRSEAYQAAYRVLIGFGNSLILDNRGICESQSRKWWENKDLAAELRGLFHQYLDSKKDNVVVLRGVESHRPCILPYTMRFDGNYREVVNERLGGFTIERGTLLTLTCDPKNFDNLIDAAHAVKKGWNRVRGAIKLRFVGKDGDLRYLMVMEFAKKQNLPHLHIILDGIEFDKEDIKWLRELWKKHVATFIQVSKIYNVGAARYVLKYLKKTFNKSGVVSKRGNAWCYWITNVKFYSVSVGLIPETDTKLVARVVEELGLYDELTAETESESYEYVGFCSRWHMEDPPEVMGDEWLLDHGWCREVDYEGNFIKWVPPPDVVENQHGEVVEAGICKMEENDVVTPIVFDTGYTFDPLVSSMEPSWRKIG